MNLRTKILLWLTPVFIPLMLVIYLNYWSQKQASEENILRISSLAVEDGTKELDDFFRLKEATFKLLAESVLGQIHAGGNITSDQDNQIGLLMKMNPGFSMLVITDKKGHVLYNKVGLSRNDIYIHPRDITGKTAIDPGQINLLMEMYNTWARLSPALRVEISNLEAKIEKMSSIGQTNSLQYRQLQLRLTHLKSRLDYPPHRVSINGKTLAVTAGLPFRSDSYVFTMPVLDEAGGLAGFLLGVLDWTIVENKIYQIKINLKNRGLPNADVVLYNSRLNQLLINTKRFGPDDMKELIKGEEDRETKVLFSERMDAFVAYAGVVDDYVFNKRVSFDFLAEAAPNEADYADDGSKMFLVAFVPLQDILIHSQKLLYQAVAAALLSAVLLVGLISYIGSMIVKPLVNTSAMMKKISQGDFSSRVSVPHQDEIGRFANSFNDMAEKLEEKQRIIEENTQFLSRAVEELKQAKKEAETATEVKGKFLANMSHEIRTPMNAIIGMTHLVLNTDTTPKQRNYMDKIMSSAQNLMGIIDDILDHSKIEAGKLKMEQIHFRLDDVLANVANIVSQSAEEKGLEIVFDTDPEAPQDLIGDPLRLGQILINLTTNAVKFTQRGEVAVLIASENREENRVRLQFTTRDTGIGLSRDQIRRLFTAFTQADGSVTRKHGGTGLGLTICKRLVELMDGEIWIESQLGKGSSFHFTAWFELAREIKSHCMERIESLSGLRVLVVDDNPTARQFLTACLKSFSFKVESASSGEETLKKLQEKSVGGTPYDLIIMDWKMPGMDGIETTKRIKAQTGMTHIPEVLMITAYQREAVAKAAEDVGVDGFLIKPVSRSLLFDAIVNIFEKSNNAPVFQVNRHHLETSHLLPIRGANILLVEDNDINREIAVELLKQAGMTVTSAHNGKKGVEAIHAGVFDLVFMDIQMPEMDGIMATRIVREDVRFRDLPIIAMTAHAMAEDREKSLEAGMNDHLTKPINPEKLFAALLRWIKPADRPQVSQIPVANEHYLKLPVIPGVDTAQGLRHIGGNTGLYVKVLHSFYENHHQAPAQFMDLLEKEHIEDACRLVHTIKGIAGNIGATLLFESARALELVLNAGGDTSETLEKSVVDFKTAFKLVIEGLKPLALKEPRGENLAAAAEASLATSNSPSDTARLAETLGRLEELISTGASEAEDLLLELSRDPLVAGLGDVLDELRIHLENFDFDEALSSLKSLAASLDVDMGVGV